MHEILYYDANPTVRALMETALQGTSLLLVGIDRLEECESVLRQFGSPALLLIDLTRQPHLLPVLQGFVPRYLALPERCILMSTRPTDLAPYLPKKMEECFFRHVIERPFKIRDLIGFMAGILNVEMGRGFGSISMSFERTDVNQILNGAQAVHDEKINREVDGILKNATSSISGVLKHASIPLDPIESVEGVSEEKTTFTDGSLLEKMDGDSMDLMKTSMNEVVDLPRMLNPQIIREQVQVPPVPAMSIRKNDAPAERPVEENRISIPVVLNLLKGTMLYSAKRTLVCMDRDYAYVAIFDSGRIVWVEKVLGGMVVDEASFFQMSSYSNLLPVSDVMELVQKNVTVPMAISVLEADSTEFVMNQVRDGILDILKHEGECVQIYEGVPKAYASLMTKRPILGIDVMPMLFDYCRENEESVIAPVMFKQARFVKRPCRTPLNAGVRLSKDETGVVSAMAAPVSLNILKATGKKGIADMLYRLVMFEFCDLVGGFGK